jgi:hypothetical protein
MVTVKELLELCKQQVAKGNGDKIIVLSNDDEGNGYHEMIYHFTEDVAGNDLWGEISEPEKKIILG